MTLFRELLEKPNIEEEIKSEINKRAPPNKRTDVRIDLPLSDACKRILAYIEEEHKLSDKKFIGTEHFLVGTLREEEGIAAQVLRSFNLTADSVRNLLL